MDRRLKTYLDRLTVSNQEQWDWGEMQLQSDLYLTQQHPAEEFVTSIRAIVVKDDCLLVLQNLNETHILPGGRCELNESFEETLERECIEETGWQIEPIIMIAMLHCHHLTPKPNNYIYPYPDFCQIIFLADAKNIVENGRLDEEFELGSEFRLTEDVRKLPLTAHQHILLKLVEDYRKG